MPQIGWFEILIIVILAILIIGPKDFPIILRKIGNWIANIKKYFGEFQKNVLDENISFDDKTSLEKNYSNIKDKKKENE